MNRTIEIAGFDAHLSVQHGQVSIARQGLVVGQVPAREIGLLIIDTPNTMISGGTAAEIMAAGGVIVFCGPNHLPQGMMTPLEGNQLLAERSRWQQAMGAPLRKRTWQQIVQRKIQVQAQAAKGFSPGAASRLSTLHLRVRSGDPANVEAQAARVYWQHWLPKEQGFRRDPDGAPPNLLLNYGYAIVRAATARAIIAAGLHPIYGLQHCQRSNSFCLADDLMEPFRPWVDRAARELHLLGYHALERPAKARLLAVLYEPAGCAGLATTVQGALDRTVAAYLRRVAGERLDDLPELNFLPADTAVTHRPPGLLAPAGPTAAALPREQKEENPVCLVAEAPAPGWPPGATAETQPPPNSKPTSSPVLPIPMAQGAAKLAPRERQRAARMARYGAAPPPLTCPQSGKNDPLGEAPMLPPVPPPDPLVERP